MLKSNTINSDTYICIYNSTVFDKDNIFLRKKKYEENSN